MRYKAYVLAAALFGASTAAAQAPATNASAPNALPSRPILSSPAGRPTQTKDSAAVAEMPAAPTAPQPPPVAPPVALNADLATFDDRLADLLWVGGLWQLWAGPHLRKDFGRREHEARQALAAIRQLHLTQRGTVGSPRTIMEYWLADGRAPTGLFPGLRTIPIDQASLRVEAAQGYWWVRDNSNMFFNFGGHQEEAQRALAIIKHHGFARLGLIGQSPPVMLVFLGVPAGMTGTPLHAPPAPKGRVMAQRHVENTSLPFGDVPASTLQTSHMPPSGNLAGKGESNATNTKPKPAGSDLAVAAMPFGRQLAPPSAPSPDLTTLCERVPLDFRQVRLFNDQQNWKLLCGDYLIATFGPNEREARIAEMAFRTSRFTEQCLVGHPKPAFSYFLVNGQPPRQLPLGAQSIAFRPDELTARQINDAWAICDSARPLFMFGNRAEEAKETLKAIQHHRFDTCCRLGEGEQPMIILARTR